MSEFDRRTLFPRLIYCLNQQTYKDFELIYLDDNCDFKSLDILKKLEFDFPIKYINIGRKGSQEYQSAAIPFNIGVKYSTGEYLLFPDPEHLLPVALLQCHINTATFLKKQYESFYIGTSNYWALKEDATFIDENWKDVPKCVEYLKKMNRGVGSFFMNLGIPKKDYEKVGGLDEKFIGWGGGDDDFAKRCNKANIHFSGLFGPWKEKVAVHQCHTSHFEYGLASNRKPNLKIVDL